MKETYYIKEVKPLSYQLVDQDDKPVGNPINIPEDIDIPPLSLLYEYERQSKERRSCMSKPLAPIDENEE